MKIFCSRPFSATALSLLAALTSAHAAIINIDLGNSAQETSDTGWNNLSAGTGNDPGPVADLVDSTGTPTTIDLAYSTPGADSGAAGSGANIEVPGDIASYPAAVASQPTSALYDSLFVSAHSITLTFSDLKPNQTYDFLIYGGRGNNGAETFYDLVGATTPAQQSISDVYLNDTETVSFTGIAPDGSNEISLTVSVALASQNGAINSIQITSVPEPGSALLLGLGVMGSLIRRRR